MLVGLEKGGDAKNRTGRSTRARTLKKQGTPGVPDSKKGRVGLFWAPFEYQPHRVSESHFENLPVVKATIFQITIHIQMGSSSFLELSPFWLGGFREAERKPTISDSIWTTHEELEPRCPLLSLDVFYKPCTRATCFPTGA